MTWLMTVHRKEHFYFGANVLSASSKRKDADRTGWRTGNWCSEWRVSFTHRTTQRRSSTNSGCVTRSYPLRKTKEMCNVDRSRCLQTILLDRLLCSFFLKVIENKPQCLCFNSYACGSGILWRFLGVVAIPSSLSRKTDYPLILQWPDEHRFFSFIQKKCRFLWWMLPFPLEQSLSKKTSSTPVLVWAILTGY